MNVKQIFTALILLAPAITQAQGYAGLGQSAADGFQVPERGTSLSFPRDHSAHPDFRIEWWYLTANLKDNDGQDLGIQWTLFRSASEPQETHDWQSPQLWLAHAAVTTADTHRFAEKLSRGGIGQAGVIATPFEAWIDDWRMAGTNASLDHLSLTASGDGFAYDLQLRADGQLVFHGDLGYSVKSEAGQASYYYSQPHYKITGQVTLDEQVFDVNGSGWLDREWSSQPLADDQSGWDWFSLNFDDNSKLMGFVLRGASGPFTSGSWINPEGSVSPLPPGAFQAAPVAFDSSISGDIPTSWKVTLPERSVDITVTALNPDAWMETSFSYWEGPVKVTGSHNGRGYLEMTGYGE
ncbi:iron ABC transporter permease [Epibacterium ulvae]|uniref:lipocalin-like domain-containing protein n=1 Tax=Epibacterium ulvae TaxID=1156985 RepID=UPI001BFC1E3D|nr:lipocalin-like domain-containing protein [Epibacterium ulvae]MBT8154420.1 iron ABC transporter permease [Epibacterium ulvae]